MTDFPPAHTIKRHGQWDHADDSCVLTYDDRFLRRKRLLTSHNRGFLVDLAHTESLNHGDAFELEGGQIIEVIAAKEALLEITGDDLVRLTATEIQLMRIFAAQPGAALSRSKLVEELGRDRGQAQERAVDVQITRLRRKIEDNPKQPRYLQTVRGAGYMLAPD